MKDLEVELIRPPIVIRVGMGGGLTGSGCFRTAAARYRADLSRLVLRVFAASDATEAGESQASESQATEGQ
jgi:hypothetical protein